MYETSVYVCTTKKNKIKKYRLCFLAASHNKTHWNLKLNVPLGGYEKVFLFLIYIAVYTFLRRCFVLSFSFGLSTSSLFIYHFCQFTHFGPLVFFLFHCGNRVGEGVDVGVGVCACVFFSFLDV